MTGGVAKPTTLALREALGAVEGVRPRPTAVLSQLPPVYCEGARGRDRSGGTR